MTLGLFVLKNIVKKGMLSRHYYFNYAVMAKFEWQVLPKVNEYVPCHAMGNV
jgi:hypothetical protein